MLTDAVRLIPADAQRQWPFRADATQPQQNPAVICFSHLRWNFVYQRPQHLMSRFAGSHNVYFFEEPVIGGDARPELRSYIPQPGITVVVPYLPATTARVNQDDQQRALLDELIASESLHVDVVWYYTPISLAYSRHLAANVVVYDCMDELTAFRDAAAELVGYERELLRLADIVFTGGHSLYEAKRKMHPNVHAFPSSVDAAHFRKARLPTEPPLDQLPQSAPLLGFYGVLDERLDTELVRQIARLRPGWQFVFAGPVAKIDPDTLPREPNIRYLGPKQYDDLPAYLAGWDVAMMPFAINAATRFISPTKTPEYLAAGRPVVSTPIPDVVRSYGDCAMVRIAGDAEAFVRACDAALASRADPVACEREADRALGNASWDRTWAGMFQMTTQLSTDRAAVKPPAIEVTHPGKTGRSASPPATPGNDGPYTRPHKHPAKDGASHPYDYLVVGAGFAGSVLAERLAGGSGKRVLVVDKRSHVGGNAHDYHDDAGILVHKYGPHIFHTNSQKVVDYLSRFTSWRPYEHRVLACVDGMLVPMPVNLTTLSRLLGRTLTAAEAERYLARAAVHVPEIRTSEDVVISQIGRGLYEKFFQGYTRKQWGLDPSQLDASVAARVPARLSHDDRYFTDVFQAMPLCGYTTMFQRMLSDPRIEVRLGIDYRELGTPPAAKIIYTGRIDEYFDYCYGQLPYRSLRFQHRTVDAEWFQPVGVVNYPSTEIEHTRITEFKHLTGQRHPRSSVMYEFPSASGDPYYPIPRPENTELYKRYQALADASDHVTFAGRLATYRYYNMDQVVAQALTAYARIEPGAQCQADAEIQATAA
jgi:UDP-galactopyranose mutase